MSEHQKQSAFIKALIYSEDTPDHRRLRERVQHAESNEKCCWRAVRMMGLIALLAAAALGHMAVLLPDFFNHSAPLLVRTISALALAAGICFVAFFGYWLWHRALVNRAYEECRRFILAHRPHMISSEASAAITAIKLDARMYRIETPNPIEEEKLLRIRNAS